MSAKSIRLIASNRPAIENADKLRILQTRLGSIGYRISLFDMEIAWTDYSRKRHPHRIITDDGAEWIFAKIPEDPREILEAIRPYVLECR